MKREMYCWRRIQLQVLLLFMAWLRLSSYNSNKQQAIQTGLKRRKSIKSISSKLIGLMDKQTRRVVETVNSYQEVQPCFFYIFASSEHLLAQRWMEYGSSTASSVDIISLRVPPPQSGSQGVDLIRCHRQELWQRRRITYNTIIFKDLSYGW